MKLVDIEQIYCSDCEYRGNCQNVFCDVKEMPVVDAMPVVRCRQCIYHEDGYTHWCNKWEHVCPDDSEFFCKFGQRKEADREV